MIASQFKHLVDNLHGVHSSDLRGHSGPSGSKCLFDKNYNPALKKVHKIKDIGRIFFFICIALQYSFMINLTHKSVGDSREKVQQCPLLY